MKTEKIMRREFLGREVGQSTSDEFYNATDMVRIGNAFRKSVGRGPFNLSAWLKSGPTVEFIRSLTSDYGIVVRSKAGRYGGTWVHPLLAIDIALAIDPDLKKAVYSWVYDELIKNRRESCDSYKLMSAELYSNHKNVRNFPDYISGVALQIKKELKVNDWERADEATLMKRNQIHESIAAMARGTRDNDVAVKAGIQFAMERSGRA